MKKFCAILLIFVFLILSGCSTKTSEIENTEYLIAFNPSVILPDGTVNTAKAAIASSMSNDLKSGKLSFYNNTSWRLLEKTGDIEWGRLGIGYIDLFYDSDLSPYSYKSYTDSVTALSVYDSSKIPIESFNKDDINKSGAILSLTGDKEIALSYIVTENSKVSLIDRDNGKISLVKSFANKDTSFFDKKGAKKNIVLRIYVNNRVYWQEILNKEKTSVDFPDFDSLDLKSGDIIMISALPTDDIEGVTVGNCDIPAKTIIVKEQICNTEVVEYETTPPEETEIPFNFLSNSNFTYIYGGNISEDTKSIIDSFMLNIENAIGTVVNYYSDKEVSPEDHVVLIGDTKYPESKKALQELKDNRNNNGADYIIRYDNGKVVIAALNDISLEFATEFFMNNYCKDENSVFLTNTNYVSSKYNEIKDIYLAGNKLTDYRIVIPKYSSLIEVNAAEYFVKQMMKSTGIHMDIVRDDQKVGDYEILIGNTNRTKADYSKNAEQSTNNEYIVNVKDKVVEIVGKSTAATNYAVRAFVTELNSKKSLNKGYTLNGKYDDNYSLTDGYKLMWSDEFNDAQLSKTWVSGVTNNPSVYGGKAYYEAANSYVENGCLVQKLNRDGNDVQEAQLTSEGANGMMFQYGYMEFRAKLSDIKGSWGAFWAMSPSGTTVRGEIDVFENFGNLFTVKHNMHTWGPGDDHEDLFGDKSTYYNKDSNGELYEFSNDYHLIGIEWEKGKIDYYVDGNLNFTYTYDPDSKYSCFDSPFFLILSHWGGRATSQFKNCILPDDFTEAKICYDWIRIYQKNDNDSILYVKGKK